MHSDGPKKKNDWVDGMAVAKRSVRDVVEQRKQGRNRDERQGVTVLCGEKHDYPQKRAERRSVVAEKNQAEPERIELAECS